MMKLFLRPVNALIRNVDDMYLPTFNAMFTTSKCSDISINGCFKGPDIQSASLRNASDPG